MRETNEMQPQYRRPLRPGHDPAARRTTQQPVGMIFGRIPKSVVINFAALIVLFSIVFVLQTFGDNFRTHPANSQPSAKSISVASMPAIPQADTASNQAAAADTNSAGVQPVAQPAAAPVAEAAQNPAAANSAPSVYTLPQKQAAAASSDEEIKPVIDVRKTSAAKKQARLAQQMRGSFAEDRNVSIDELDNESARAQYISANRGAAYPSSPAPMTRPIPRYDEPAPKYERSDLSAQRQLPPAVYDLDDESARQNYIAENRRSAPGASGERSENKQVRTRPAQARTTDDDFIPYEQGK